VFRSAFVVAVTVVAIPGGRAAAATCVPAVLLAGAPGLTHSVAMSLARSGIASREVAGCPPVRVWLVGLDGAIAVTIEDGYGRRSERHVASVETAAALVETWARGDLPDDLLTRPPAPDTTVAPLTPPVTLAAAPPPLLSRMFGVGVAGESSIASDATLWLGASAACCARIGPLCAGALARLGADQGLSGVSRQRSATRLGFDVLLGASVPLSLGRVSLAPGAGVGVGWLRSRAPATDAGGGAAGGQQEGDSENDSGGLRAEVSIAVLVPLARDLSLSIAAAVDLAPLARAAQAQADDALPREPWGYLRLGAGLRWGTP
jgi:hypothetical protein